jgi:hypothetical protein
LCLPSEVVAAGERFIDRLHFFGVPFENSIIVPGRVQGDGRYPGVGALPILVVVLSLAA